MQTSNKTAHPELSRIRGPHLKVARWLARGTNARRALEIADEQKGVLPSNKRLLSFFEKNEWRAFPTDACRKLAPCWGGMIVGYIEPGKKLESVILHTDSQDGQRYVFPVPEQAIGKIDTILLAEHPDYFLLPEGKDLVIISSSTVFLDGLPPSNGRYAVDKTHGIPFGERQSNTYTHLPYFYRASTTISLHLHTDTISAPEINLASPMSECPVAILLESQEPPESLSTSRQGGSSRTSVP